MTFEEIGLHPNLLLAVKELGFENPTPIQEKTIPHLLNNADKDLIALAQTGTGKTAAFGLPVIQQIDEESKKTQCIILSPTRELCIQIAKDINTYSKFYKKINVTAVYGGASIENQIKDLSKGAQIVVGTPGRTLDLIKRKKLKLNQVKWLILDEADEMLNMGFKDELDKILIETPKNKQTLLFSATMSKDVARIARNYMKQSEEIKVGQQNSGAENVEHQYYLVRASDKYAALKRITDINPDIYGIVFCRTRRDTKDVAAKLVEDGYNADALHGDLSQAQRDTVMQKFRIKNLQILVATDVAARGLDVNNLTHVINYSLPDDPEVYIHRSGRTGRAGKSGLSVTISHSRELNKIRALEKMVKKPFKKVLVPQGKEIVEKRLYNLIDNINKTKVDEKQIAPYLDYIFEKLGDISREELIKKFVSVEFSRFVNFYKEAKDLNIKEDSKSKQEKQNKPRNRKAEDKDFIRFYINIGTKMNVNPALLIGIINENTKDKSIEIGRIDLMKGFSFFETHKKYEKIILKAFKNAKYKNQKLIVEVSNSKPLEKENLYGKKLKRKKR